MALEPPTDTLPRYRGSIANGAWCPPFASLDSGRMRSLTDGRLYKIAHRAPALIKGAHSPAFAARLLPLQSTTYGRTAGASVRFCRGRIDGWGQVDKGDGQFYTDSLPQRAHARF